MSEGNGGGKGAVITVAVLAAAAAGVFGYIKLNPKTDTPEPATTTVSVSEAADEAPSAEATEASALEETGGDTGEAEMTYIRITVSEGKYLYENSEISFDELKEKLSSADENTAVVLKDDSASLDAFKQLTDHLDEKGITYLTEE